VKLTAHTEVMDDWVRACNSVVSRALVMKECMGIRGIAPIIL